MQVTTIVIMNEHRGANFMQIILHPFLNETDNTTLERQCDIVKRVCFGSNIEGLWTSRAVNIFLLLCSILLLIQSIFFH